jgi:hypothetical protein
MGREQGSGSVSRRESKGRKALPEGRKVQPGCKHTQRARINRLSLSLSIKRKKESVPMEREKKLHPLLVTGDLCGEMAMY